jgi:hypothetical protein
MDFLLLMCFLYLLYFATWGRGGGAGLRVGPGEGVTKELANGSGVFLFEVVMGVQGLGGTADGFGREREDLKAGTVEGYEVLIKETVADCKVALERDFEDGANPVVAIKTHATAVGGKDEKEVEGAFVRGELCKETVAEEAVWHEGEALASDLADSVR